MLTDFRCGALELDRYLLFYNEPWNYDTILRFEFEKISRDLCVLDQLGFSRLGFSVRYNDQYSCSRTMALVRQYRAIYKKYLSRTDKRNFQISFYPSVTLNSETPFITNLATLSVSKPSLRNRYLLLEPSALQVLPDFAQIINKILYNCRLTPVFLDFQLLTLMYDKSELEKLYYIPGAAFQFSLRCINDPCNLNSVCQILKVGNTVFLGTDCGHDKLNPKEIAKNLDQLKKNLGEKRYKSMNLRALRFPI